VVDEERDEVKWGRIRGKQGQSDAGVGSSSNKDPVELGKMNVRTKI